MDFVGSRHADGRWFRTLTVLDLYTRESLALVADRSLTGGKVAAALTPLVARGAPTAITVDNDKEIERVMPTAQWTECSQSPSVDGGCSLCLGSVSRVPTVGLKRLTGMVTSVLARSTIEP
jgi:hypothetical protein